MKYVPLSAVMAVTVAGHAHMHCYILREKDQKKKKKIPELILLNCKECRH